MSGDVIVDDRLWGPHRLENEPITPIIINQNVIDFTITPGAEGQPATAEMRPQVAPWTVRSEVQTVAAGQPKDITVTSPEDGVVVLSGTIAADAGPVAEHLRRSPTRRRSPARRSSRRWRGPASP